MNFGCLKSFRRIALLMVGIVAFGAISANAQTYNVLSIIQGAPGPQFPQGTITQGRDGSMYTVSNNGGVFYGTVFSFSTTGVTSVVYDIGYLPTGGITLGTDGSLYGQDSDGGISGNCGLGPGGQIYKVTTTGVLTVLHNFIGGVDGCFPYSTPIQASNGTFYGTTPNTNNGTVYSVTSNGTFNTLHTFTGTDGQGAYAPLVQGTDGNFYGATAAGGSSGDGVIFKMTPTGTVTVLHNFAGNPDGAQTYYGLLQASDGNFYGVASSGGTFYGTVFKITPAGVFTVLHTFTNTALDGANPSSSLMQATDGKLYGVTSGGGAMGVGTIYSITTAGTYSFLYSFIHGDPSGENPASPLKQNTNGKLYGDTYNGGLSSSCNCGVIYSLDMGLGAFVNLVSTSGAVGAKVEILGQGFSAASVVKFNGVQASTVTRTGTTFLSATVPAAALTGKVTVTTGSTTLTSAQIFKVKPTITAFDPPSGPVGTSVNLAGSGFTQATKVTFNNKSASFTVDSDTQITTIVPTGATTGKIAVTTKGGSASSTTSFTVN